MTVSAATKTVHVHAKELDIREVTFTAPGAEPLNATVRAPCKATCALMTLKPSSPGPCAHQALAFDLEEMTLAITFKEELALGAGVLAFKFVGQLNNQMAGFYRSSFVVHESGDSVGFILTLTRVALPRYTAANGEKRIMASTQFEALDARRCFPCWDEPARKATFAVTLVVPVNRHAFSNMPEVRAPWECRLTRGC